MAKQEQQQWNACSNGSGGAIDNSSCISRNSSNGNSNSNGGLQLQSFFKSIFSKTNDKNSFRERRSKSFFVKRDGGHSDDYGNDDDGSAWAKLPVPHLSPPARSVISRCSKLPEQNFSQRINY
ncbi:uncharacterized protein LOC113754334 isoform X1 [Coffea eugenioides]|uniref:Uncharacterized protein n=1 Tax=Coffea arabica TaxID=13443 RepID=A0ABM4V4P8_COFAR|nr:uncharacterized protein LOC113754334 isoform X1 [Coffea eugenioides]